VAPAGPFIAHRGYKGTILSLTLNLVCFATIATIGERLVEAEAENLSLFRKLSIDPQSLRRELNRAAAQLSEGALR
jgi:hypothetical protein